jgi:hypothetical protein
VLVLLKLGFNLYFHENSVNLSLETSFYGNGYLLDVFIVLDVDYNTSNICFSLFTSSTNCENSVTLWHARLGHLGQQLMNSLAKNDLLGNVGKVNLFICEYCVAGKTTIEPFEKGTRVEFSSQLINYDICGPMNMRERYRDVYYITFIDDFIYFFNLS